MPILPRRSATSTPRRTPVRRYDGAAHGEEGGHSFGHSGEQVPEGPPTPTALSVNDFSDLVGRGEWIRTTDLLVPNQEISTTYRHPSVKTQELYVSSLDPIWTLKANVWRTGLPLDPAWTLISTLVSHVLRAHARSRRLLKNLAKICCSDRISKSPIGARAQHGSGPTWRSDVLRPLRPRLAGRSSGSRANGSGDL